MKSPTEIQAQVIRRAEELARAHNYQGPGKFSMRFYKMALQEVSPQDRLTERNLSPPPVSTPEGDGAYLLRTFMAKGLTREQAEGKLRESHPGTWQAYSFAIRPTAEQVLADRMAALVRDYKVRPTIARAVVLAEDAALRDALANLPDGGATARAERQRFAAMHNASPARMYAGGPQPENPWHVVLPKLTREEVLNLLVEEKLSTVHATEWLISTMMGKKPLGLDVQALQEWDARLAAEVKALTDEAQLIRIRQKGRTT